MSQRHGLILRQTATATTIRHRLLITAILQLRQLLLTVHAHQRAARTDRPDWILRHCGQRPQDQAAIHGCDAIRDSRRGTEEVVTQARAQVYLVWARRAALVAPPEKAQCCAAKLRAPAASAARQAVTCPCANGAVRDSSMWAQACVLPQPAVMTQAIETPDPSRSPVMWRTSSLPRNQACQAKSSPSTRGLVAVYRAGGARPV